MSSPRTIAHYRIVSKLGEGGMGAVYRAMDTKLHRDVAIKVLPAAFAEDAARMRRFEREAQVLASLNHPNIAAIYGIEAGALVMELVEGSDLAGPVPLDTAIAYARQIADGLEAAHEKGIVHRDLKPANVKVTADGAVKLLDFGLAKATGENASGGANSPTMSPTLSMGMTEAGTILGTAAYMSPEQARGKPVDKRADIWAFGVVLYELLAGHRPFAGDNMTDTLAAVVLKEPDYSALPQATPPGVRRLLRACLRKDPKQRLRDIGDARLMLDESETDAVAAQPSPAARRARLPWIVAGLGLAAAGLAVIARQPAKPPEPVPVRFPVPWPAGTIGSEPSAAQAIPSPDGRYLAIIASSNGQTALWVRPMGSTSAYRLDQTDGANFPFWSPDGQFIAFFADEKLKKIPSAGGSPLTLCDAPRTTSLIAGDGGTWNDDGVIVFALGPESPLLRVPAAGGPATPATTLDASAGETRHSWPQFLPDGRHLLYFAGNKDPSKSAIYVQELGSSQRTLVTRNLHRAAWSPPGYLLYPRERALFAQRVNPRTFQLTGEPIPVAEEVNSNDDNGRSAFAVSGNGTLVYLANRPAADVQPVWYGRDGKRIAAVGKAGAYASMRPSPDEKSVALAVRSSGRLETWIMDLTSGALRRASTEEGFALGPWSPDSERMAINEVQANGILEFTVASGGTRPLNKGRGFDAVDWAPDNRFILCNDANQHQLVTLTLDGNSQLRTVNDTPYRRNQFRFSPDGKFVAYTSVESGSAQVFVASFPSFSEKRQISVNGGQWATWKKDGREVFFRTSDGTVMSGEIRTEGNIEAGIPKPLFKYPTNPYTETFWPTGDGKRFLVLETEQTGQAGEIMVALNWTAELKRP